MSELKYEHCLSPAEIQEILEGPNYDFLRADEHLKNGRLMFLTLGGSYSYGTNVPGSDLDVRGCAMNRKSDLIGLTGFEQVIDKATDTTVYAFNKLIPLLMNCNPNVIEMLGCKPEHYLVMTPVGKTLIDNRKLFLSKRAVSSFGGYAIAQLRRLQTAIARNSLPQAQKEEHMRKSMENSVEAFRSMHPYFPEDALRLFTDDSTREDLEKEVFADVTLRHFPARQFAKVINDLNNVIDSYEKLNKRNNKKTASELNKHAMHLVRLYLMCIDILEKEEIVTYREADHDLLMEIRNGKYMNPDGTYQQEFFDMVDTYEKRMKYAAGNTSLPKSPDVKKVEELVMSINEISLNL